MKLKPFVLLTFIILFFSPVFCQQKKDTVYFDEDWSICEQPVAEYYRVCDLNRTTNIFYKGDVEDFYINGSLEMKGHYNEKGSKNGDFIFYNKMALSKLKVSI